MTPRILLVNPPIYDFSAYDFWMRPFGLLRVAGMLRGKARMFLFDAMNRSHPSLAGRPASISDRWGRGKHYSERIRKPPELEEVPRNYRRLGLPRHVFVEFLREHGPFDFALIQTTMTYWYPGVLEILEDLRRHSPGTQTVLGGVYATLCPEHARGLRPDCVVAGLDLSGLWRFLGIRGDPEASPLWEAYEKPDVGVLKLADGCPFKCTYCSVPAVYPQFRANALERSLEELRFLSRLGARNIVFYDDALLYQSTRILIPFLDAVERMRLLVNFHTPNALNARFITPELAEKMVGAGFKTFYLGFESSAYEWQTKTGGKVYANEFARAVEALRSAGADMREVRAYLILGHPHGLQQNVEASIQFAQELGIRVMLSEFSPIPGTPDGESCRRWVNLDEPLTHNKTFFPIRVLGAQEVNRLKHLCHNKQRSAFSV